MLCYGALYGAFSSGGAIDASGIPRTADLLARLGSASERELAVVQARVHELDGFNTATRSSRNCESTATTSGITLRECLSSACSPRWLIAASRDANRKPGATSGSGFLNRVRPFDPARGH